jgi:hypothetical protein
VNSSDFSWAYREIPSPKTNTSPIIVAIKTRNDCLLILSSFFTGYYEIAG